MEGHWDIGDTPLGLKLTEAAEGDRRSRCLYCSGRNQGGREREERAWLEVTEAAARRDNLRRDETIVRSPVVAKWSPCCDPVKRDSGGVGMGIRRRRRSSDSKTKSDFQESVV